MFADDQVLITQDEFYLECMFKRLHKIYNKWDFKITLPEQSI
jgi:hypothetical protein